MSQLTKEQALGKLQTRSKIFGILTLVFLVLAVVLIGIWVGSMFYATPPLFAGIGAAVLFLACFGTWFLTSSLSLHAAATK